MQLGDAVTDGGFGRSRLEEEGEDIEVIELGLDDAIAQVADGRMRDGKTVLLLQWAELNQPA